MKSLKTKGIMALIGCSSGIFFSGVLIFGYPGFMGPYWRSVFEVDTTATGNIMTFILFALGIFMFFGGKFHQRLGTRKSLIIGTVILVIAMLILQYAKNMAMVYLWAFLNGTSSCFIYGPGLTTVQKWFPHRRGIVTGILNFVFGISAAIMLPILNVLFNNFGYHMTNSIIILLIVIVNGTACILSEVPEKSGLSAEEINTINALVPAAASNGTEVEYTVGAALKTKEFWALWLVWVFMGAAGISMISLSTNYSIHLGISSVVVLSAFNITNGVSRIIAGFLSDKIGSVMTGCIAFLLSMAGYILIPFTSSLLLVSLASCLVGFAFGTLFAITAPLASGLFGLKHFGMIFGLIFTAYGFVGGILGPTLSGYILQKTDGNFKFVFAYLAIFSLIAAGLILLTRKKQSNTE